MKIKLKLKLARNKIKTKRMLETNKTERILRNGITLLNIEISCACY